MARALKLFIDECLPERLPQQRREPSRNSLVVSSRICVERVWRSERTKVYLGKENSSRVGAQADVEEAFHYHLSGQSACESGVLTGGEKREGKHRARAGDAKQWREQFVGVLNLSNLVEAMAVERGGGNDKNGRVDQQSES